MDAFNFFDSITVLQFSHISSRNYLSLIGIGFSSILFLSTLVISNILLIKQLKNEMLAFVA